MNVIEPDEQRANARDMWERASTGWGKRADRIRDWGMPVSMAMVDALALQPGQKVLELAAGPGDTGFLAAELIQPGGTLISSDGAEAMVEVARERAAERGLTNVEFKQLELEWIDMETATVDGVLCRWAIMLIVDPEAAAQEIRRVLKPGGRAVFAVWDGPEQNLWATIPNRVMVTRGHAEAPDPRAPGMFALAGSGKLEELLGAAGFTDVIIQPVELARHYEHAADYVAETADVSPIFSGALADQPAEEREAITAEVIAAVQPFTADDGSVTLPGSSLVAVATA
ncbi:MAG: methyltransferase domain-containing protein [Solirubrobacteraceae bacterium]